MTNLYMSPSMGLSSITLKNKHPLLIISFLVHLMTKMVNYCFYFSLKKVPPVNSNNSLQLSEQFLFYVQKKSVGGQHI